VVFLEPTRLYRLIKEEVADDGQAAQLDACFTAREGSDITLVAWGAMVHEGLAAADDPAEQGIAAEVIDVATLKPLDMDTILASIAKTGRCVVVTEAPRTCSYAAEVAANLAEDGLLTLLAPVQRVAAYDVVVPLPRLEHQYMPDKHRIIAAVKKTLAFA
jgi:2-oxoisovalerate dehydrogenase E1 component subunit beta